MTPTRHSLTLALCACLVACGSKSKQPPPPESAGDLTVVSKPGAVVVAEVNGKPVYGDCVAIQVEHGRATDAQEALQQCIDFELLAQEAHARGYLAGRELIDLRKQEATRLFIESDFGTKFATPADIPEPELESWYKRIKGRYVHPEFRKVCYVRVPFPKNTPRGSATDWAARSFANELYEALKGEFFFAWKLPRWGMGVEAFRFVARRVAGHRRLEVDEQCHTFKRYGPVVEDFRRPSFEIPRVGMMSPPSRTDWGWDIILLVHIEPAKNLSYEQAKPEVRKFLFEASRGRAFLRWSEQFVSVRRIKQIIQQQSLGILQQMQAADDKKNLPPLPTTDPT